ncbi:MAG: peptidylprolyl isomerase [Bacteroidales bacterium]|nr:peptidylprolyl isomerase [Bacteroidales bacterium]
MKKILSLSILLSLSSFMMAQGVTAVGSDETVVDKVVAVVGKNIVKLSDVENGYLSVRVSKGYENAFENRCNILEGLLINKLLVHKGEVDSTEVTDQEIEANVQYYLKQYERQYGSHEAIRQATGYTYDEMKDLFTKMMRERMLAERVRHELTNNVKITPYEVQQFFNKIPADSVPEIPETIEVAEIVRKPQINDEERERVKLELNKLRERILNGDRFTTLATLYSEDPGSSSKGGELGFFTRGDMVGEFEAAAFALKPGEVSPVIETQFGFHIIQLIERRGNAINCRHILMMPKVSAEDLLKARMLLDSVAREIRLGHLTFAEAAKQYSDDGNRMEGGRVTHPQTGSYQFTLDDLKQLYPNISFASMNAGDISNATALKTDENKDAYRLMTVVKRNPSHKANLKDDYDRIFNAALENAKQEKIFEWAQKTIKNTYIKIDDEFKDCSFKLKWE